MAAQPIGPLAVDHSDTFGADVVDQVLLIPVDQIDEGERLRAVDPVWAEALAHMMRRDGQKKSIEVCRLPGANRWTLVDGAHRLAGARQAGIAYLRAEVVSASREERRLREVLAQLAHRGLSDPLDRAAFVAELVQLKRAAAGFGASAHREASVRLDFKRAITTETNETLDTMSNVYGWSDEVGAELGFAGRTVRRDLELYRGIAPSLVAQLRERRHPVLRNAAQLRLLAKLDEAEQRRTVRTLMDYPALTTVAQARVQLTGPERRSDPETKRLSAFVGAFSRMSLTEKKGALAQLGGMLPAGFRLVEGKEAPAKPAFSPEHVRYREETATAIDDARALLESLDEDEVVKDERSADLLRIISDLGIAALTVRENGFELGAAK